MVSRVDIDFPTSMGELHSSAESLRREVEGGGWTDGKHTDDHSLSFGVRAAFVILQDAKRTGLIDPAYMACMIAAYMVSCEEARAHPGVESKEVRDGE